MDHFHSVLLERLKGTLLDMKWVARIISLNSSGLRLARQNKLPEYEFERSLICVFTVKKKLRAHQRLVKITERRMAKDQLWTNNSCFYIVAFCSRILFVIASFSHLHTEIMPGSLSCHEALRKSHHKITTMVVYSMFSINASCLFRYRLTFDFNLRGEILSRQVVCSFVLSLAETHFCLFLMCNV